MGGDVVAKRLEEFGASVVAAGERVRARCAAPSCPAMADDPDCFHDHRALRSALGSRGGLVFIDCEASGPCPGRGELTEFGAVDYATWRDERRWETFRGLIFKRASYEPEFPSLRPLELVRLAGHVFADFAAWLRGVRGTTAVSDNPAFDWQWVNHGFHHALGRNPLGHSCRRIGDFYAGLTGDFRNTQAWKRLRRTPHDHDPVHDAMGNVEAFERIMAGER